MWDYESLLFDGPAVTKKLAEWLGYTEAVFNFGTTRIKKQAGEINAIWRRQFLEAAVPASAH